MSQNLHANCALGYNKFDFFNEKETHLHGYEKLAETVVKCCKTQFEKSVSAASIVSARPVGARQKTFYWCGFVSPVGSSRPASHAAAYLAAHPGGGGKWCDNPVNTGKNAIKKQGGRKAPPVLLQELVISACPVLSLLLFSLCFIFHLLSERIYLLCC
jgi:hypothetical protein